MRVEIDGVKIELLGDPHLGKRFVNGVPLHRRGEREAMVRSDFEASLAKAGEVDLHVCLGDLFNASVVPYETILHTGRTYLDAIQSSPDTTFVVIRGNHDQGRDLEAATAFDLFTWIVHRGFYNVHTVTGIEVFGIKGVDFLFVPWGSNERVANPNWVRDPTSPLVAFGHWDVDPIAGPDNLIPTKALAELGITRAFTGHVHKPHEFTRDGVHVTVVGSLQPFAHGEEADDSLYVTVTRDQVGPHLRDKVVRIDLAPGEARDVDLDCLQLTYRMPEQKEQEVKVELGEIDLPKLTAEVLAGEVRPSVRDRILDTLIQARMR